MKKVVLSFICFLTACSSIFGYDKEFKNPIFNQPLRPLSKTSTWTYLTPTSYVSMTPLDKNKIDTQGKCDLVENKQDRITLKCIGEWYDGAKSNSYFTYVITDLLSPTCLIIEQYYYSTLKEFPKRASYGTYCITPLNDTNSESD
ncbi:MAG: hypothetical protein IJ660_01160 [Alphaproteobacteria bacterium]|nr:hypothetical protein [Alphaproteobacteria bacterium]